MHPSTRVNLIEKGNMTNCGCEIEIEGERSHDELIKLCKYLRATGAVQHPARRRAKGVERRLATKVSNNVEGSEVSG